MELPTNYQSFIHVSRYARWNDARGRRETWDETVDRYITFMVSELERKHGYTVPVELAKEVHQAILHQDVMPSMRAMMTAGPALQRDNVAGYNCAYLPVDSPRAFDEALYVLMCGAGVGFSVERRHVENLPVVNEHFEESSTVIRVADSKAGWARAFRELVAMLYAGQEPQWDVTGVRPAGARLKTFGGRASGPGPLEDLFRFTIRIFREAAGRRLSPLECHDLMCKIGEIVVVGGVRRSAMISLSNLSDNEMRHAKSGAWWEHNVHRALANNSTCYTQRPDVGSFMEEWLSLYQSKSGERGIFNRQSTKKIASWNGRRDPDWDFGTNPCSEIILRPYQFCNLTEVVVRADDTTQDLKRKVRIASVLGTWQATLTDFKYLRKVWKQNTEEERLLGVSLTGIMDHPILNGQSEDADLPVLLQQLKAEAVSTNAVHAQEIGIPQAAAVTCVKPSGTVSQLVDSASGIHTRHSEFYIRRVRGDKKDPLSQFMVEKGVPHEEDVYSPANWVFAFPQKAPEGALTRDSLTAIEHLELWKTYQENWCEHKPSITVTVKEHEWPEVGAWVWENFDLMSGVSFLPHDGGTYKQAPYEAVDALSYGALKDRMPELDWRDMDEYEDNTEASQTLACTGNSCEIADFGSQ